jgi:hypothetical protein
MRDLCKIGVYSDDTFGPEPEETFEYGPQTRCRYFQKSSRETVDGKRRANTDIEVHFPSPSTISETSRIQIIRRNGATLETPEYLRVTGEPWNMTDQRTVVCQCDRIPVGAE